MDERLEALSDKVRSGIPVSFGQAIEVIKYQERLRFEREAKRRKTLLEWLKETAIARIVARVMEGNHD